MSPSATIISLPDDVTVQIVSSLQVVDVCSLGSCSKFWLELCESAVWEHLCKFRWPQASVTLRGSRGFYIAKHNEMASKAASVFNFVERCLSFEVLDVGHYLNAIEDLYSMQFGFKDIQMSFLKSDVNVLFNLIGLHYCISWLSVPAESVIDALRECKISEREVCVMWQKRRQTSLFGLLKGERYSRHVSLSDLSIKAKEVLEMLQRGTTSEVSRVLIYPPKPVGGLVKEVVISDNIYSVFSAILSVNLSSPVPS